MIRTIGFVVSVVAALFGLAPVSGRAPQSQMPAVVAMARQALGGDAALAAVRSFAITGYYVGTVPTAPATYFETICELPDKFLRVSTRKLAPASSRFADVEVIDYDGFVGTDFIRETVAPDAPFPLVPPGPPPTTPEAIAADRQAQLDRVRRIFLQTLLPLFVALPDSAGIELTDGGKAPLGRGRADVVELQRSDGERWRLFLDEASHLPAKLTWRAPRPTTGIVSVSSDSRGNQQRSATVTSSSNAGAPDAIWEMTIGDYKTSNKLNWPRRFKTWCEGQMLQDVSVTKFTINPTIDPKRFAVGK